MKKLYIILFAALLSVPVLAQTKRTVQTRYEKLNELYCSGPFESADGSILEVANNSSGYTNVLDWLQGRIGGYQLYYSRTGLKIPLIRGRVPGIFIDEMPSSAQAVNMLSMHDIAIVKIIKTPFFGGSNSGNGAILIYTIHEEEDE
jgi:hypothetical protein